MNLTIDQRIDQIARRQHGVVARWQLLAEGLSPRAISRRVATGRLRQLHLGIYAVGPMTPPLARETAAVLACGGRAWVSHVSACGLWEVRPLPPEGWDVEVTVPRSVRIRRPGIRAHQASDLLPEDLATVQGIPVTAPARTLVDLAAVVSPQELERAVATAERSRLVTLEELVARLERHRGRPGTAALAQVLGQEGGPAYTRSRLEELFREEVPRFGLPTPRFNPVVHGYEVDCYWPDARLGLELDGRTYHASWAQQEKDRQRDADLSAAGIQIVRITWRQLVHNTERTMVRIAQALAIGLERAGRRPQA